MKIFNRNVKVEMKEQSGPVQQQPLNEMLHPQEPVQLTEEQIMEQQIIKMQQDLEQKRQQPIQQPEPVIQQPIPGQPEMPVAPNFADFENNQQELKDNKYMSVNKPIIVERPELTTFKSCSKPLKLMVMLGLFSLVIWIIIFVLLAVGGTTVGGV